MVSGMLFVGESRSKRAKSMGVHWKDGRLAAKSLFDALKAIGIDPTQQEYVNLFERKLGANVFLVLRHKGPVVAMGKKVQSVLSAAKIPHIAIVHPAARGTIRLKANYIAHLKEQLLVTPAEAKDA
jgi:hypothetical protein